jgi:hypothetical protein
MNFGDDCDIATTVETAECLKRDIKKENKRKTIVKQRKKLNYRILKEEEYG